MLERLFGEERRRTKVIPNAFGERPVMKLMYAALIRATEKWRGLRMTAFESKQLEALKAELDQDYEKRTAPAVNDLKARRSPSRVSSRSRT
jgi:transposase-like protein